MSLKIKIKTVEPQPVGAIIRGDIVTPAKPDGGEVYIRIVDWDEVDFFEVGKTYIPVEEPSFIE